MYKIIEPEFLFEKTSHFNCSYGPASENGTISDLLLFCAQNATFKVDKCIQICSLQLKLKTGRKK